MNLKRERGSVDTLLTRRVTLLNPRLELLHLVYLNGQRERAEPGHEQRGVREKHSRRQRREVGTVMIIRPNRLKIRAQERQPESLCCHFI